MEGARQGRVTGGKGTTVPVGPDVSCRTQAGCCGRKAGYDGLAKASHRRGDWCSTAGLSVGSEGGWHSMAADWEWGSSREGGLGRGWSWAGRGTTREVGGTQDLQRRNQWRGPVSKGCTYVHHH